MKKIICYLCVLPLIYSFLVYFIGFENGVVITLSVVLLNLIFANHLYKDKIDRQALFFIVLLVSVNFDSEPFLYGTFNIRFYQPVFIILFATFFYRFAKARASVSAFLILIWCTTFMIIELMFLRGKLDAVKYTVFYIYFAFFVAFLVTSSKVSTRQILEIFCFVSLPFLVFGIIQFLYSLSVGFNNNPLLPPVYNLELRPVAFFSETTWLSEMAFFVLLGSLSLSSKVERLAIISICLFVIIVTVTRNTYLAILVSLLSVLGTQIVLLRVKKSIMLYVLLTIFLATFLFITNDWVQGFIIALVERFTDLEKGGGGRLDAFKVALNMFVQSDTKIFGNGFDWNSNIVAGQGSSLGAKAFNSLIMLNHIYGPLFVILILFFIFKFVYKCMMGIKRRQNDIVYYIYIASIMSFLSMSLFAPIHQYPLGALLLGLYLSGVKDIQRQNIMESKWS